MTESSRFAAILAPSPRHVHPAGSHAYLVHLPVYGFVGVVGNHHADRPQPAVTRRTTWWAQLRQSPEAEIEATCEHLPAREAAVAWLQSRVRHHGTPPLHPDERFAAHIAAVAADSGHDAAWSIAAQVTYLRLHDMLARRFHEQRPAQLWREVITMISWFDAALAHPATVEHGEI